MKSFLFYFTAIHQKMAYNFADSKFKIQYVSDIHLEFRDKALFHTIVTPTAPYLALAGDIGKPGDKLFQEFLKYVSENWKAVFYITGNHEYYTEPFYYWKWRSPRTVEKTHTEIEEIVKLYPTIYYLHAGAPVQFLPDDNVVIIGTTLWSHIPDHLLDYAHTSINDYKMIPIQRGDVIQCVTPLYTREWYAKERAVLADEIAKWSARGTDIVVLTHHMPSLSLVAPQYKSSLINCCFASECDDLMLPRVRAWIYGHTHAAKETVIGTTLCAVNAVGYPKEQIDGFSINRTLEFSVGTTEIPIVKS